MPRCKLPAYNWRWRHHNTVPLLVTYQEYSDGVGPSPKGGAGAGSAPSKSATASHLVFHTSFCHFISHPSTLPRYP